jgi:UDP-N-acetylglucosamine 2-epimerase
VTLLDSTEWTETLTVGANRLAGCEPDGIVAAAREAFGSAHDWLALFGDGTTAQQIAAISEQLLAEDRRTGRPPGGEAIVYPPLPRSHVTMRSF